jgi:hypothetical protein
MTKLKVSAGHVFLPLGLALVTLGVGFFVGANHPFKNVLPASETSFQQEMDAYCTAKLNDDYLSNFSPDERKKMTDQSFFSRKLHTCVHVEVTLDPKNAGAMNYVVSDLTYGFTAPPKWHYLSLPLHVIQTNYGSYHSLQAEGYWAPVSSDPGQKLVADANAVKLTCEYTDGKRIDDEANSCTETDGYAEYGGIKTETQTFHIASWSRDEVIATAAERGISASSTATLLIHPEANEVEVVDRTRMNEKQPEFFKGMEGKSFGGHYELHGGMYMMYTDGTFFQCNEDGVVIDMRTDVVQKHHGDVVYVPSSEWNAGAKADHKFTQQECNAAMQKKLGQLQ